MATAREAAWPRHRFTVEDVDRMVQAGGCRCTGCSTSPPARSRHEEPRDSAYARVSVLVAHEEVELPGTAIRWKVGDLLSGRIHFCR